MPAGGEWVDLPPLTKPVLPELPTRSERDGGPWSERARQSWEAWRSDPASGRYTPADVAYALDTVRLLDQSARHPSTALSAEIRLRLDGLGLTPRGRRALRWRLAPAEVIEHARPGGLSETRRRRLRAVDPRPNGGPDAA